MSWNGLAISSFARASKILKCESEGQMFYFPVTGTKVQYYRLSFMFGSNIAIVSYSSDCLKSLILKPDFLFLCLFES